MTSLAAQLASIASLDSSRLASSSATKTQPSYLFTPTEAAQHDLETIHSLGLNGFEELKELDSSLGEYEEDLFGEASKGVDRMVISREENDDLGRRLDELLRRLGRHVPTRACGKVIEWLVRRFRSVRGQTKGGKQGREGGEKLSSRELTFSFLFVSFAASQDP